jgi:hypothetical protein
MPFSARSRAPFGPVYVMLTRIVEPSLAVTMPPILPSSSQTLSPGRAEANAASRVQ